MCYCHDPSVLSVFILCFVDDLNMLCVGVFLSVWLCDEDLVLKRQEKKTEQLEVDSSYNNQAI